MRQGGVPGRRHAALSGERTEDGWSSGGARLHAKGKVVGLERGRNLVRVNLSFEIMDRQRRKVVREVTKDFSAAELPGRTALLLEEERSFSIRDRIVTLKNNRGHEVCLDLNKYRHLDHAYAVTIYKSQGATVEHSILYAPVRRKNEVELNPGNELGESYGRMSYNALNVAVTRARFTPRIFTNSIEGLERSVTFVDGKSSMLGKASDPVREMTCTQQRDITERLHDLRRSIGELERGMLKRGDWVCRAPCSNMSVPLLRAPD